MSTAVVVFAVVHAVAFGSEFTVRWADKPSENASGQVSLYEACTSYECAMALLEDAPASEAALVVPFEAALFRGEAPAGDTWWTVLEGRKRMPMAMLWRPPTTPGHLPAAPVIPSGSCGILVRDAEDNPVAGASAVRILTETDTSRSATVDGKGEYRLEPSVLGAWRPWSPPVRTNSAGRAAIHVPHGHPSEIVVGRAGYRSRRVVCPVGDLTRITLYQANAQRFRVLAERGAPLARVVARDENGWPVAVSDDHGWLELGVPDAPAGDHGLAMWFESAEGAIYTAERFSGNTITAREASRSHRGMIGLGPRPKPTHLPHTVEATPTEVFYWRDRRIPWPEIDPRAAPALRISTDLRFEARLQRDEALWFAASERGYAYCRESDLAAGPDGRDDGETPCATLIAAQPVVGLVTSEDGEPIADAEILIDWQQDGGAHPTVVRNRPRARPNHSVILLRSDSGGRFASDRIGHSSHETPFSGVAFLRVAKSGYVPIRGRGLEPTNGFLNIELSQGARVAGRVLDRETQSPIAGADVALGTFVSPLVLGPLPRETEGGPPSTTTAPDGSFELRARPGSRSLLVRARDHAPLLLRSLAVREPGVDLGQLYLERGFEMRGVVLDTAGHPIPGAHVRAAATPVEGAFGEDARRRRSTMRFANSAQVVSDHQGHFLVPDLGRDSVVDLLVSAPGFAPEFVERHTATHGEFLEVRLRLEAVVEGRVRIDGRPAVGRISLQHVGGGRPATHLTTNEKGEFRIGSLHAGRYNATLSPGEPGVDNTRTAIKTMAGEVVSLDFNLEKGTKSLSGRVTTASGTGLGGAEVHAQGRKTMTAPDGSYVLSGLGSGSIDVRVSRAGWAPLSDSIRIGGPHGVLDFAFAKVPVEGYALWADGSPVANQELRFGPPPEHGGTALTDGDGYFRIHLEPQGYIVAVGKARSDHQKLQSLRVDGPTADARIRFGRRLRIRGWIDGLTESELARLKVEAVNADDQRVAWGGVDASGRFGFDWVDAGIWNVIGTVGSGERRTEKEVRLADQDIEVNLKFRRLFELSGVARLGGEPLRSTRVVLLPNPDGTGARYALTLQDGSFRFADVARGEYQVGIGTDLHAVRVESDEYLAVDLVGGWLRGAVDEPEASMPRPGAKVLLWPGLLTQSEAGRLDVLKHTFTDAQGTFSFGRLPEGPWTLHVPELSFTSSVQVDPGAETVVDVP